MKKISSPTHGNEATPAAPEIPAIIMLDGKDLPAYCPNPNMPVWSSHPRVFLDMHTGCATCAYCGTTYQLAPNAVA